METTASLTRVTVVIVQSMSAESIATLAVLQRLNPELKFLNPKDTDFFARCEKLGKEDRIVFVGFNDNSSQAEIESILTSSTKNGAGILGLLIEGATQRSTWSTALRTTCDTPLANVSLHVSSLEDDASYSILTCLYESFVGWDDHCTALLTDQTVTQNIRICMQNNDSMLVNILAYLILMLPEGIAWDKDPVKSWLESGQSQT